MTPHVTPLLAGNWKMNGLSGGLSEIALIAKAAAAGAKGPDLLICPPATLIREAVAAARGSRLAIGGQDCHPAEKGAFTGDLSAEMLNDAGARFVIVGHSERRTGYGESDRLVRAKAEAAIRAGLTAIVCIGETLGERRAGLALTVLGRQLEGSVPEAATDRDLVVAYEPVWAIGTGLTPSAGEVAEVHHALRRQIEAKGKGKVRILYGGSVKPDNAAELMAVANVDGALIGGASLKAADFLKIVAAVEGA